MKLSFYYRIFIFVITMLVWYLIYLAKISDYSINYEYEFKALELSLTFSIVLTLIFFYRREFYKKNIFYNNFFLITSSPISLLCFIRIYVEFFGPFFKF